MKKRSTGLLKERCIILLISFVLCCIDFAVLQLASMLYILSLKIGYGIINIGIIAAITAFIYSLTGRLWLSHTICSFVCVIYSIVNQYVIEFHGSPLTIPEFSNAGTAMNVLSGYSLLAPKPLLCIAIICFLSVVIAVLVILLRKRELRFEGGQEGRIKTVVKRLMFFVCSLMYIVVLFFSTGLTKPLQKCWHFKEAIGKYGYPLYFLASGRAYEITIPDGYSEEAVCTIDIEDYLAGSDKSYQTPDIILILNESFYDISLVADIDTDTDYLENFYNIDNAVWGYAVAPMIGGGTNNSEFELLTSNSTYLLQGITPFRTLNMSDTASIVSNLKALGYYTIGMHPAPGGNYTRNTGYSKLGFDEIHFIDDYTEKEYYGERMFVTDACAYDYMIQWYEEAAKEDKPIFSYLLTIQNHGGWDVNTPEEDIVHVENYNNAGYGKLLNEFLSCNLLSVNALNDLTEYFRNSDRPVIICMVGDHAPTIVSQIANKECNHDICFRSVPYLIWANFPIEGESGSTVGMNGLVPILLDKAGVNMMPYYRYILQLAKEVPILTSYGGYMDIRGNIYTYEDDTGYSANIKNYFLLEYNNLQKTRMEQWFQPVGLLK